MCMCCSSHMIFMFDQIDRFSIFSDFDAVKAHMQIQHKLGPKSIRFLTICPQCILQVPRTD